MDDNIELVTIHDLNESKDNNSDNSQNNITTEVDKKKKNRNKKKKTKKKISKNIESSDTNSNTKNDGGSKKDFLDPKSKYFNPKITKEDRYPLDCSINSNKKKYLCDYFSEDKNKFKKRYPIDCKTAKYKNDRRCRTYAKKVRYSLDPRNKVIIRTPELQQKHNQFKKRWNESKQEGLKRRREKEIEKKTIEILEKTQEERKKILSSLDETERNKIKEKINELIEIKKDEEIEKISKQLLNEEDEKIRNQRLLQIKPDKREKIKIKMKQIIENKEENKKKPSFLETNSFELLNTLNVIENSVDHSLVELNTVNTKIIDNFRTTMKDRIRKDKLLEERRKKMIPYGWDISKFDGNNYYVFNLDFKNFRKKFDSIELDDVFLNENNLVEKLEIEDTNHTIIHDEDIVKYKSNVIILDNNKLENIKFDKLQFIGKNLMIDGNPKLKNIKLSKLKTLENIEIDDNENLVEIDLSSLKSVQKLYIKGDNILKLDIRNLDEVNFFGDYLGGIHININATVILNKKIFDYYNSYYNNIKVNPTVDKNQFAIISNWIKNAEIIQSEEDRKNKTIVSEEDEIKGGIFSNLSLDYFTNYKKKKIIELNQDTINKAILIESVYYSYFNEKNYDLTKIFLEEKKLEYFDIDIELSISESSVLINKNSNDIFVVYRGSIIKNNQDLLVDITFYIDHKNKDSYFKKYKEQIKKIKNKYNKLPVELIGHSRGHYTAYVMGDLFSINTTGFNSTFGKHIIDFNTSNKIPIHNFYRVTDDIASYNISIKKTFNYKIINFSIGSHDTKIKEFTNNKWNVYNIHPLKSSVTYLETHYINNFVDNSMRKNSSSIEDIKAKSGNQKNIEIKLQKHFQSSLLSDSPLESYNVSQQTNKVFFAFSKYRLLFRNKKIFLYSKIDRKILTENEFAVLAKKKTMENDFNKMKKLKIIELKQQGWTIITNDRDFYKHESNKTLFDSKIYRLYKKEDGIYSLYNKYTHNIVTIEQAISESKNFLEKLGEALDWFFYIEEDSVIPYRVSTFFFLSVIIPLSLYAIENILTIILNFVSLNVYNFILDALDTDFLSDNLKKMLLRISNLERMIIHLDDWIRFDTFYIFLFNIVVIFKIFVGNNAFNAVMGVYITIVLIFGFFRSSLIYTVGAPAYHFPKKEE